MKKLGRSNCCKMRLVLNPGQQVWFCSDPHYNHKNICRGVSGWSQDDMGYFLDATRDFPNLEKMNSTIVDNINYQAMEDDIIFCLGDWSFGGFESIKKFWERINCKNIHLILGNHDHHIERNRDNVQSLFNSVNHYLELSVKVQDERLYGLKEMNFVLCHYPIASWNNVRKGTIQLHGHEHFTGENRFGSGKQMDVGFDGNNFQMYSLPDIHQIMRNRPIKTHYEFTHHENEF